MINEIPSSEDFVQRFRDHLEAKKLDDYKVFFKELEEYFEDKDQFQVEEGFLLELAKTSEKIIQLLEKRKSHPIFDEISLDDLEDVNDISASLVEMTEKSESYFKRIRKLRRKVGAIAKILNSILILLSAQGDDVASNLTLLELLVN